MCHCPDSGQLSKWQTWPGRGDKKTLVFNGGPSLRLATRRGRRLVCSARLEEATGPFKNGGQARTNLNAAFPWMVSSLRG